MPEDSVILVSPSTMKGMVPSGLIARYSLANTRGGNGSIFSSYGSPISSSIQSGRNERAPSQ